MAQRTAEIVGIGHGDAAEKPDERGLAIVGLAEGIEHDVGDVVFPGDRREVQVRARVVPCRQVLAAQPVEHGKHGRHRQVPAVQGGEDIARGQPLRVIPQDLQHRSLQMSAARHVASLTAVLLTAVLLTAVPPEPPSRCDLFYIA